MTDHDTRAGHGRVHGGDHHREEGATTVMPRAIIEIVSFADTGGKTQTASLIASFCLMHIKVVTSGWA